MIEYCADISSRDYGDARRAIDLFRAAAEIAAKNKEKITTQHVDKALHGLSSNRIIRIIGYASVRFKTVCFCLARLTYLTGESWHSTSAIYHQYRVVLKNDPKPLGYKRFSEYLAELVNDGIAIPHTYSKGRGGYGTSYKLSMPPHILGRMVHKDAWKEIEKNKAKYEKFVEENASNGLGEKFYVWEGQDSKEWSEYVGSDESVS